MKKLGTFLAALILIGVFFTPGLYGFIAVIILLLYGLISFPYRHLREQSIIYGKWRVNWSEFRQQLFLNSFFVLVFSIIIMTGYAFSVGKILLIIAVLLITIIYALLMAMYKEELNPYSCK